MNLLVSAAITVGLGVVLPAACYAQPVINPKPIPPWVSEKEAAPLAASAKKEIVAYASADMKVTPKAMEIRFR